MKKQNIIAKFLEQVDKVTKGKPCVFRGENRDYGQITCTLYRELNTFYREQEKTIKETSILNNLDFPAIEQEIIKQAKSHFSDNTSDIEILTEIQHYGGKTTLIDFTHNILIALFFACNGEPKKDGRIICLDKEETTKSEKLYDKGYKNNQTLLLSPKSKSTRVIFQSSVFVHEPKGLLEVGTVKTIDIKIKEKQAYLYELKHYHGIDATTVFNDLQGFIANKDTYKTAQTYFYIGVSYQEKSEHAQAIKSYDKAILLQPNNAYAYYNRGVAYQALGKYEEAIKDLTQAIQLQPDHANAYNNRGLAHEESGDRAQAQGNAQAAEQFYTKALQDYQKLRADPRYKDNAQQAIQILQEKLKGLRA